MDISPAQLRQVVVFEHASGDDLMLILQNSIPRRVEDGGFFFFQGDPADFLYVLTSGMVKLLQSNPSGQQVNLRTLYPWQMFGALGAVRAESSYPASAQALGDSSALAIGSDFMHSMLETRPALAFDLMKLMTSYIQEMQARYRELSTERVEQRIAHAVLRLASQTGRRTGEEPFEVELEFSRQDLAEMTGTTLYTVSRTLSEWDQMGIIQAGRERIKIKNPHRLVEIAERFE
jgi:CRP-like cAMP-binding protein